MHVRILVVLCILIGLANHAAHAQRKRESTVPSGVQIQSKPLKVELPANVEQHLDLVYATYGDRKMQLDLFVPKGATSAFPAIMVVHGGGWLKGDKSKFRALAQELASRGYVTAAVGYRLGGEAKFPAAIHDCNAATRWMRANASKYKVDPHRIGAVGGSAGGHLVGLMASAAHLEELQGDGGNADVSSKLQAAIVMAGPMQMTTGSVAERSRKMPDQSNSNKWLGKTVDEAPELYKLAEPLAHINKNTPSMIFQMGQFDVPQRNVLMRQKLHALGIRANVTTYFYGKHGCWNRHPWFGPMVDDMDSFFRSEFKVTNDSVIETASGNYGSLTIYRDRVEVDVAKGVEKVLIPRLTTPIKSVYLKGDNKKSQLKFWPEVAEWRITLPKGSNTEGAEIIIETSGQSRILNLPSVISESNNGVILAAHHGMTFGQLLRYEPQPHKNTIGYWANEKDYCEWFFYIDKPGKFDMHILQGCGKGHGGSQVHAIIGDQRVQFKVEDTGHFQNFKDRKIGQVELAAGSHKLRMKPIKKAKVAVMDVRQVRLLRTK